MIDSLGDAKHINRLREEQRTLDELTGYERAVCDLNEYRAPLLVPVHEDFDRLREDLLVAVPGDIGGQQVGHGLVGADLRRGRNAELAHAWSSPTCPAAGAVASAPHRNVRPNLVPAPTHE